MQRVRLDSYCSCVELVTIEIKLACKSFSATPSQSLETACHSKCAPATPLPMVLALDLPAALLLSPNIIAVGW